MAKSKQITITENEAVSLCDFIETEFLRSIRNDTEMDSLMYAYNILNIYRKCGGLEQFSDYESSNYSCISADYELQPPEGQTIV